MRYILGRDASFWFSPLNLPITGQDLIVVFAFQPLSQYDRCLYPFVVSSAKSWRSYRLPPPCLPWCGCLFCLDTVACLSPSPVRLCERSPLQFTYRIGKVEHLRVGRLTHAPYLWLTFVQNRKVGTISKGQRQAHG